MPTVADDDVLEREADLERRTFMAVRRRNYRVTLTAIAAMFTLQIVVLLQLTQVQHNSILTQRRNALAILGAVNEVNDNHRQLIRMRSELARDRALMVKSVDIILKLSKQVNALGGSLGGTGTAAGVRSKR
jgi:hypothetical protein